MMDYSDVFNNFLNQSIYSLEATAKDEIPLIRNEVNSMTSNQDKYLDIMFDVIVMFADLYNPKCQTFIKRVLDVNDNFIGALQKHQNGRSDRERIDSLVQLCAYNVKKGSGALKDYLAVFALCFAATKGHLSSLDKERYTALREGWEKYF